MFEFDMAHAHLPKNTRTITCSVTGPIAGKIDEPGHSTSARNQFDDQRTMQVGRFLTAERPQEFSRP